MAGPYRIVVRDHPPGPNDRLHWAARNRLCRQFKDQVAIGRRNERAAWLAAKAELVEVGQDGYSVEVQP